MEPSDHDEPRRPVKRRHLLMGVAGAAVTTAGGSATASAEVGAGSGGRGPGSWTVREQGGFSVGGRVISAPGTFDPRNPTNPAGQTLHGDHARVFYQVPERARRLPLVLWHGLTNRNVKGVIALEPGSGFVFPEGEVPAPMPSSAGTLAGEDVSRRDFRRLTRGPIAVYYGDNIPRSPMPP